MTQTARLMKRPMSLTARVMIFVVVAIGVSLFTIGHLVENAVERHFAEQDAEELVVITSAVENALETAATTDTMSIAEALSSAVSGHHGVYFQVWGQDDSLIYNSGNKMLSQKVTAFKSVINIEAGNLQSLVVGGETYSGAATQVLIDENWYRIVAAIDMNFHIQFLTEFRHSLWLIMTLAGIVTLLAAWFGVHQGHAPLRGLSAAMRDVQADRLDVRLDVNVVPSELKNLVISFNYMIQRLEDSFNRLSHFSADIAHELRTPLTNLITQTQVALGKSRSLDEYRELLYSNLEEQERLAKMVNDMLWLAQSEHGLIAPIWESLDLVQEVSELFDFFEALAEDKQVKLALQGETPVIHGDRAMLRRAISNLLSNAIRHTAPGHSVLIRLGVLKGGAVFLSVQNPGNEIPTEHLPRLFDRFYRIDPSRTRLSEGAGLGLALVKSIVDAHRGTIEVTSVEGVTTFTLYLGEL